MSLKHCVCLILVIAAFGITRGMPCGAQTSEVPVAAPVNPAFERYLNQAAAGLVQSETEEGRGLGLIPPPVDLSHMAGAGSFEKPTLLSYPATYDLRTQGKLTSVKNQASCGSCWAFAAYGSLESWLMPTENLNFSENNLKDLHGFDPSCCAGGNHFMSTAYLARWSGPVSESDDPYSPYSCYSPTGLPVQKHVQNVLFIPDKSGALDNDNIKYAVTNYGALYTHFYYSSAYYNSTNYSYYCGATQDTNHAVCIVGWDDNYDRSRFNYTPPGNGAFIAKNSWGTGWGESGYFYMSYYDPQFGRGNAMFQAEPTTNYSREYSYDPLGWVGSLGYSSNTAWFANVFTATSSDPMVALSFYAASPNATYTIYVYLSPTSGPINPAGPVLTQSGTVVTPGYRTINLSSAVSVTSSQRFSIVVRLTTPGYNYPVPFEFPLIGYSSAATANPGESYISASGVTWSDLTTFYNNANVCLKAFASQGAVMSVSPATGLSSSGYQGGPFTPSSQVYTLSNSGGASLNWTATHSTATWVTISPTSGTLAAGATATVSVSINSNANSLPAGTYNDTINFTNTTNGVGNTTRAVQLTISGVSPLVMVVTPDSLLASSGPAGGPFTPASLPYAVANQADYTIDFVVTHDIGSNWLTVYETLLAHQTVNVTVAINLLADSLSPGTYLDHATFTNLTNGVGNTVRNVQLTVLGADMTVTPAEGFTSTGTQGGPFSPPSKQYVVTNSGGAQLNWSASHNLSVNWLTFPSASGTLNAGESATVTANINSIADSLPGGTYNDTLTFTNLTNGRGNTTRGITLTVLSGRLEVSPADGLSSSGVPGGPFTPNLKQYVLSNPGSSAINWTAAHGASATWVTLSNGGGALNAGGSATVTVSINSNANLLPAGTYNDTVAFTNTTNHIGDTTRPVTLSVASKSLTSVVVSPSSMICPSNDPRQVYATAYFSDSSSLDVTTLGTWTSSNTAVATVSSSGIVTPKTQSSTTVTCTYSQGGVTRSGTCGVQVRYQTVYYIAISPSSFTFYQWLSQQFVAQARTSLGWLTVTDQCTWTSTASSVASVDVHGLVTPVSRGATAIRASYLYSGAAKMAQSSVKVAL